MRPAATASAPTPSASRFPPAPARVEAGSLRPAPIELAAFLGAWYERYRIPAPFERGLTHGTAEYALSPDGSLRVTNQGWDAGAAAWSTVVGRAVTTSAPGVLGVSFGGPYAPYVVLAAERRGVAYTSAVVGSPSRGFLWVITRERDAPVDLPAAIAVAKANGYGADELRRLELVPQAPPAAESPGAQIGGAARLAAIPPPPAPRVRPSARSRSPPRRPRNRSIAAHVPRERR